MKFSEMVVKSKKGIKLESLPPTEGSAWQHSLGVYWQITKGKTLHDTTINPTELGWKLTKDRLEPVMTEQVSLVYLENYLEVLWKYVIVIIHTQDSTICCYRSITYR